MYQENKITIERSMRQVRCPYGHQGPLHSQGHNRLKTNILTKSSVVATHEGPLGCQPISCAASLSSIVWNNPLYLVDRESHFSPMKHFPSSLSPSLCPSSLSLPLSELQDEITDPSGKMEALRQDTEASLCLASVLACLVCWAQTQIVMTIFHYPPPAYAGT